MIEFTVCVSDYDQTKILGMGAAAPFSRALALAAEAKNQIKITGIETDLLRLPPSPFTGRRHSRFRRRGRRGGAARSDRRRHYRLGLQQLRHDAGGPRVVQTILEHEIKPVLMGQDPAFPKKIRADLWRALEYQGVQGVTQFAMSVVDIAVWDILGKAAGLPVYKMLGAVRDRMPVYAMCGWYRENDKDHSQYKRTINETLEIGLSRVQSQSGPARAGRRCGADRGRAQDRGKDIRIMVDANQAFNRVEALRRGRAYQQLDVSGMRSRWRPGTTRATRNLRRRSICGLPPAKTNTTSTPSWIFC